MKTKIWIAGHNGMVGSSLLRFFSKKKKYKILKVDKNKLITNQKKVLDWLKKNKPNIVINVLQLGELNIIVIILLSLFTKI